MSVAELIVALIAALPGEYTALTELAARVRASLGASDQAAIDKAVEDGFNREQAAVARADAALGGA